VSVGKVGRPGNRGIEARQRLRCPAQAGQRHAEQEVRARALRVDGERTLREVDAGGKLALLARHLRQPMQRVRAGRVEPQRLREAVGRRSQRALPLEPDPFLDQDGGIHAGASALDRFDVEGFGRLAPLPDLVHGGVGRLDVAREAGGVEQGMREPVLGELAANGHQQGPVGR